MNENDRIDLEQLGNLILNEMETKNIELGSKIKAKLEDFVAITSVIESEAEERKNLNNEVKTIQYKELPFNFNQGCVSDDDCNDDTFCYAVDKALQVVLQNYDDVDELELIANKVKISGNECVPKFSKEELFHETSNLLTLFHDKKDELIGKLEDTKLDWLSKGIDVSLLDTSFLVNEKTEDNIFEVLDVITTAEYDATAINSEPTIRRLSNDKMSVDPSTLMILSQRGNNVLNTKSLLMSMLMAGSGAAGDRSLTSNPLLVMALLDNDEKIAFDILMKMSLLGGQHIGGLFSTPLLLSSLLSENVDRNIITKLMISQISESYDHQIDPLLLISLLENEDGSLDDSLPLIMMNDDSDFAQSANPVLLQAYMNGDSTEDLVMPLLISSGALGDDLSSLLPLVMISDDGNDDSLLLFMLLNMLATSSSS